MKKLVWTTTIFVLFLVFMLPAIMALAIDIIPANDQPGYDYNRRLSVYEQRSLMQNFVSRDKNLTAIATSIRNPNLKNDKEIKLDLYDENNSLLRSSIVNGKNIEDGDFVKFIFPVIPDSLNKKYSFTISSEDAGTDKTIELFIIDATDEILDFTYLGEVHLGGVPLVTFHKPESRWNIVKSVYSDLFSRFF